jgi:hypothetical protein
LKLQTPIADSAPCEHLLGGLVRGDGRLEVAGDRPVQQVQVEVVQAQVVHAGLEGAQRRVVAVVADPQLGGDEHLRAVDAGVAEALADFPLVAVGGGRVDQPVAVGDRRLDRAGGLFGGALVDAEPEGGHLDAVVQFDQRALSDHLLVLSCLVVVG